MRIKINKQITTHIKIYIFVIPLTNIKKNISFYIHIRSLSFIIE